MPVTLRASHGDPATVETPLLVVILPADATMTGALTAIDGQVQGALARSLTRRDFRGARDETMLLVGAERGVQRVLLVGRGSAATNRATIRRAAAIAARQAIRLGVGAMHVFMPDADGDAIEALAIGVAAGAWE